MAGRWPRRPWRTSRSASSGSRGISPPGRFVDGERGGRARARLGSAAHGLSPEPRFAYVLNELAASITALRFDAESGALDPGPTISTLPPDFAGSKSAAEIRIHPSGRFLYSTNRGHDSVATFAVDASTGALASIGWVATQGETPRRMNIDPSGTFLFAANQNSDTIVVFRIDTASGKLTPTGEIVHTPNPVDIAFGGRGR